MGCDKKTPPYFFFVIALAVLFFFIFAKKITEPVPSAENETRHEESALTIANASVSVEIPLNESSYKKGLGGRDALLPNAGMLFLCLGEPYPKFWMKDMRFPIDAIWIGEDFTVSDITRNISPESFPQNFVPAKPSVHVLEVNAGFTEKNGIALGDRVYGLGGAPCAKVF